MPITLVLDQGVPRDAASRLRDLGYDCVHVGEVGMSTAADGEILSFALRNPSFRVTIVAAEVVLFARRMAYQAMASATSETSREADAIASEVLTAIICWSEQ